jgi:hypothetical protein
VKHAITTHHVDYHDQTYVVQRAGHYLSTRVYRVDGNNHRRVGGILEALVLDRLEGREVSHD